MCVRQNINLECSKTWIVSCHCAGTIQTRQGRCCFVISTMQRYKKPVPNHPLQRSAVTAFDISSTSMLSSKEACCDSQTETPCLFRQWYWQHRQTLTKIFPGYHSFLSQLIYYITITFFSCKRSAVKICSLSDIWQMSGIQQGTLFIHTCMHL